ncbi:hypothetical protein [Azospirillum thermophilum]|uniref:Uncharacterized protein n=1 Tax=Azospirillum thermophilum TaxID=2202148 RepID=A0A2S2D0Q0_9PROT|nr:hypothetical protein [Azospirillum thermophilum]AWK90343.1 hypothetical protein DEW08_30470 [Azospirillum thermophilum]
MMRSYTAWDRATGRVRQACSGPEATAELSFPGYAILWDVMLDAAREYVDPSTGEPRPRPILDGLEADKTSIQADGLDTATIRGIPAGAIVRIGALQYQMDEPTLEFSTIFPGRYAIHVESWPYLTREILIHAR